MAAGEQDLWCQGWSRAQRGQRPRRDPEPGRARRGRRRLAALRPEDLDDPRRVLHPPLRPVPHRPRRPSATAASPTSSSTSRRPASPSAASGGSTATKASPRCSSTTCSCPTPTCSASVEPGLGRRDGHHRLRAGPHAAQPRAGSSPPRPASIDLAASRDRRRPSTPPAATRLVARRWIDAEAYRWQTFWTVTRIAEGERAGAGVEHGQGVLVGARRPPARARARRCSARTPSGLDGRRRPTG